MDRPRRRRDPFAPGVIVMVIVRSRLHHAWIIDLIAPVFRASTSADDPNRSDSLPATGFSSSQTGVRCL